MCWKDRRYGAWSTTSEQDESWRSRLKAGRRCRAKRGKSIKQRIASQEPRKQLCLQHIEGNCSLWLFGVELTKSHTRRKKINNECLTSDELAICPQNRVRSSFSSAVQKIDAYSLYIRLLKEIVINKETQRTTNNWYIIAIFFFISSIARQMEIFDFMSVVECDDLKMSPNISYFLNIQKIFEDMRAFFERYTLSSSQRYLYSRSTCQIYDLRLQKQ